MKRLSIRNKTENYIIHLMRCNSMTINDLELHEQHNKSNTKLFSSSILLRRVFAISSVLVSRLAANRHLRAVNPEQQEAGATPALNPSAPLALEVC